MRIKLTFKLSIMFLLLMGTICSVWAQTGDLVKMRTTASTLSLQVVYSGSGTIVDANGVTLNSGINIVLTPDGSGNVVLKAVGIVTLTELYFNNMNLTTLDVSACTALYWLDCANNTLTTLDVSACTALTVLQCYNNTLTTLGVSNNTVLSILNCTNNTLTTLDVSTNTALSGLVCVNNKLNVLDVSINTALTVLDCSNNTLTTLDVSKNTALKELDCRNNILTTLNISGCTALTDFNASGQTITVASGNLNPVTYIPVTGQAGPIIMGGLPYNFGDPLPNGGTFTTTAPVGSNPFSGIITINSDNVGIEAINTAPLTVYPNPTYGQISVTGITPGATIRLYTALGSLVATYKADDEKMSLDLSPLAAGMYFINVDGQTLRVIRK